MFARSLSFAAAAAVAALVVVVETVYLFTPGSTYGYLHMDEHHDRHHGESTPPLCEERSRVCRRHVSLNPNPLSITTNREIRREGFRGSGSNGGGGGGTIVSD